MKKTMKKGYEKNGELIIFLGFLFFMKFINSTTIAMPPTAPPTIAHVTQLVGKNME